MSVVSYKRILEDITGILEQARKETVKRINIFLVRTYWQIGKRIVLEEQAGEKRARYGEMLLERLSRDLTKKFGKGFSIDNLELMRKFYILYPLGAGISETVSRKLKSPKSLSEQETVSFNILSWSHYCELLAIEDENARAFYQIEASQNNWSVRELKRQINSLLFERLALSKNKGKVLELARKGQHIEKPEDAIKNPYILEFLGIPEKSYYSENQLEQKLTDHLQEFILELGKGFTFISRQKRITIDNEHYYIDLVFYHRILRCLILIDLKIGTLSHADVGQMNFYLNYFREKEMVEGENPPIGIILCTERNKSKVFVEYALGGLNNKIFVSKYKLYLPTKKELEAEIKKETFRLTGEKL